MAGEDGEKPEGFYVVRKGEGIRHHKPESSETKSHIEKEPPEMTWLELMGKKERPSSEDDMEKIDDAINSLLNEAEENGVLGEGRVRITNAIKESDWNHVAQDLLDQSGNMERAGEERLYPPDKKEKYKGMYRTLTEGAAARIAVVGIEQKKEQEGGTLPEDWKSKHGFTDNLIAKLQRDAYIKHGEVLLPASAELLVGESTRREKEISQPPDWVSPDEVEKLLRKQQELFIQEQRRRSRQGGTSGMEFVIDFKEMGIKGKENEQRQYVRELLDAIEKSNRDSHDMANTYIVRGLETALDQMEPSVAREVKARLAVHDCSELMKQANGWIFRETEKVGPGYAIGSAATAAEDRGHALNREIVETFLRDGYLPGLRVANAWDYLQQVNYDYELWVRRAFKEGLLDELKIIPGMDIFKDLKSYFKDGEPLRKEAVRKLIVKGLGGGKEAEKSLQLAEKLAKATFEDSVFNRGETVGNDQFGEILGLKEWREKRRKDGRIRGPEVHEEEIDGFGNSWLRKSRDLDNLKRRYTPQEFQRLEPRLRVEMPLFAKDININSIRNDWVFYCTVEITRNKLLNELLLDRKPKISGFDKSFLQNAIVYFDKADPHEKDKKFGSAKLRPLWVAGVVDMVLADKDLQLDGKSLGESLGAFIKTITKEELSPEAGTFMTPTTWESIKAQINFDARLRSRGGRDAIQMFFKKLMG